MRSRLLGIFIIALALGQAANADSVYSYAVGISLQTTCLPGSQVSIDAFLLNTGSAPIVFAPTFTSGFPSAQGGSVPFGGVSGDGQWNVLSNNFSSTDFFSQFDGVTINPGQSFEFSFGSFFAPTNQALGTSATPQINFGIDFTDNIEGNLLGICPQDCEFHDTPEPAFTLGTKPGKSGVTYFQGLVVDRNPVTVPEPPTWTLLGITALAATLVMRHRIRTKIYSE